MKKTIVQASHLKQQLEGLGIKRRNSMIVSLDIKAFCLSVKFSLARKAITYFGKKLPPKKKETMDTALWLVQFGVANTLITFIDKCYECDGNQDTESKGLTLAAANWLGWLTW